MPIASHNTKFWVKKDYLLVNRGKIGCSLALKVRVRVCVSENLIKNREIRTIIRVGNQSKGQVQLLAI